MGFLSPGSCGSGMRCGGMVYYEIKCQALYYCGALRKPDDLVRAWPFVLS
jgi:hypothetical protein